MFWATVLASLAAAALAQPETTITGADGDLVVERRQQISVADMSAAVVSQAIQMEVMEAHISTLTATVDALTNADGPLGLGVQAIANDLTTRTADLITTGAENAARITAMEATLAATRTELVNGQVAALAEVNTALAASQSEINRTTTAAAAAAAAAATAQTAAVAAQIRGISSALASKMNSTVHVWTGGCANRGNSGHQEYCLNRVHIDTAAPYFRKQTNTRFQALIAGWYRIDFWVTKQSCNWGQHRIYVNGAYKVYGHDWSYPGRGGHLRDNHATLTWKIMAGQQAWGDTHAGCWHSYWSTNGGTGLGGGQGAHSRITMQYVGPIAA